MSYYSYSVNWTHSEQTVKNRTVGDAVKNAKIRLHGTPLCLDALRGRDLTHKLTLLEVNELADALVSDSYFYRAPRTQPH